MSNFMYAQTNQTKEHTDGPYIIPDCIAIQVNNYMRAIGLEGNSSRGVEIFNRLVDYSEWLEDHFSRGLDSVEAIASSFLKEYGEDLHPDDILESLEGLRADLLKAIAGLELAISQVQAKEQTKGAKMAKRSD